MEKLDLKDLAKGIFGHAEKDNLDCFKPFVARAVRKLTQRQYLVLKKIYWYQCTLSQNWASPKILDSFLSAN